MHRYALVAGIFSALCLAALPSTPAFAITAKQKMVTCVFGANHPQGGGPKLMGKARKHFIDRCMLNRNDPEGPAVGKPGMQPKPKG